MTTGMIFDGMRRKGYVPERQYVSPAVRFFYRPLTTRARAAYLEKLDRQQAAADRETVSVAMICRQLLEWDLKYPEDWPEKDSSGNSKAGQAVSCNNPDELTSHLDPYLQRSLAAVISGLIASAMDPDDMEKKRDEDASMQGLSAAQVMKEMDAAESTRVGN